MSSVLLYEEYHMHTTTIKPTTPNLSSLLQKTTTPHHLTLHIRCNMTIQNIAPMADITCAYLMVSILVFMILVCLLKTITTAGKGICDLRIRGITFPQRPEILVIIFSTIPTIITIIGRKLIPEDWFDLDMIINRWGVCQILHFLDIYTRTAALYHMIYWCNRAPLICFIFWIYRIVRFGWASTVKERREKMERKVAAEAAYIIKVEQERQAAIEAALAAEEEKFDPTPTKPAVVTIVLPGMKAPNGDIPPPPPPVDPNAPPKPFVYEDPPDPLKIDFYHKCKVGIPLAIYMLSFILCVPVSTAYKRAPDENGSHCDSNTERYENYRYYEFVVLITLPLIFQMLGFYKAAFGKKHRMVYRLRCYYISFIFLTIPYFVLFMILENFKSKNLYTDVCIPRFANGILIAMTAYHVGFAVKPIVYLTACNCICCPDTCLQYYPRLDYYLEFWVTPQDKKKIYWDEGIKKPKIGPRAQARLDALEIIRLAEEEANRLEESSEEELPMGRGRWAETRLVITPKGPMLVRNKNNKPQIISTV